MIASGLTSYSFINFNVFHGRNCIIMIFCDQITRIYWMFNKKRIYVLGRTPSIFPFQITNFISISMVYYIANLIHFLFAVKNGTLPITSTAIHKRKKLLVGSCLCRFPSFFSIQFSYFYLLLMSRISCLYCFQVAWNDSKWRQSPDKISSRETESRFVA